MTKFRQQILQNCEKSTTVTLDLFCHSVVDRVGSVLWIRTWSWAEKCVMSVGVCQCFGWQDLSLSWVHNGMSDRTQSFTTSANQLLAIHLPAIYVTLPQHSWLLVGIWVLSGSQGPGRSFLAQSLHNSEDLCGPHRDLWPTFPPANWGPQRKTLLTHSSVHGYVNVLSHNSTLLR